jgi:Cu(I)/Ag(I) efflux system membrane fusion protein
MNKGTVLLGVLGVSSGLLAGYALFAERSNEVMSVEQEMAKPLFYRNPMNPEVTSPVPAKGSMGMDYIPVYADETQGANPGTVVIDPTIQANIGLRTATAKRKAMSRTIRAVGRVDYDEEKLVRLHPKVEGWIRDMHIGKTGQPVENDDILLTIYSPKLVATQQEYLLSLENLEALKDSPFTDIRSGAHALADSSRYRLSLLDVPEHQIVELEQSRVIKEGLHIHAPAGGTVLNIGARQGQFVQPSTELYLIADLSTVWVYADIYDYELPWVREGDSVEMTLASVPGRIFRGAVAYIYPYAEAKTRTTKVRLIFKNPDRELRPQMLADVLIKAAEQPAQIVVPAEAVVRSGDYDQIFVVTSSGGLEPRKVILGIESSGEVSIVSGVSAGERVVVSAQFLVDSESKLREATAKMLNPELPQAKAHSAHEGMQHD